MKHLRMLGLAAVVAMAFAAVAASSASATTLEVEGVARNESVTITGSLKAGTSSTTARTDGSFVATCRKGHLHGSSQSPFTASQVTGAITGVLAEECDRPVTVHKPGNLYFQHTTGTNGTVFWENGEVTYDSVFGTLNCKSGAGTQIGTLTGVSSGHADLHINAVLNCGFLVPSASWKGAFTITTPTGFGVIA